MRLTWLGWAGVELEANGDTIVIDALHDAGAVFAAFGTGAADTPLPETTPPTPGVAVAGLVTHLHRDHADAAALASALAPGAPVLEPVATAGGGDLEDLALAQADDELRAARLPRRAMTDWESTTIGPFSITALPASDGLGDPQVAWLVETGGVRILHLGDTMFHGSWWRMAQRHGPFDVVLIPVNGAVVSFPHRRPASQRPVVLDPAQAATVAAILGARLALPIHAEGYTLPGIYEPVPDAAERFVRAATDLGVNSLIPSLGAAIDISPSSATATAPSPR